EEFSFDAGVADACLVPTDLENNPPEADDRSRCRGESFVPLSGRTRPWVTDRPSFKWSPCSDRANWFSRIESSIKQTLVVPVGRRCVGADHDIRHVGIG